MYHKEFVNLGNNVKKYRLQRGLTQEAFAEKIGKTANYISQLENGHKGIQLTTLFDIARELGVLAKDLLEPCEKVEGKIHNYNKVHH